VSEKLNQQKKNHYYSQFFNKLGRDIWIDNRKSMSKGFITKINLHKSMEKFSSFLLENPWYGRQKFGIAM